MKKNLMNLSLLLGAVIFLNLSCSKSSDPAPTPTPSVTTKNVTINAMSYTPATVTVQKNTNVKWTNDGGTAHTVTADNGTSFDSGSIPLNASFTLTPTVAGSYPYHCTIHGAAMAGTLVVTN